MYHIRRNRVMILLLKNRVIVINSNPLNSQKAGMWEDPQVVQMKVNRMMIIQKVIHLAVLVVSG